MHTVSICIPTYNGADYLSEALASVEAQTYKDFEVVISDDASKDDTLQILENFKARVSFPVHIFQHTPKGIGANWNHCVKHAKGAYIKFLFQDDVLLPYCLEEMVNLAKTDPEIGLVYGKRDFLFDTEPKDYTIWLRKCGILHQSWKGITVKQGILDGKAYLRDKNLLNLPNNKIGEPSLVLLKKEVFDKVGYFDTRLSQTLDFEYWYRLMPFYKIAFVDKVLIKFRLHGGQATQKNEKRKTKDARLLPQILMKNLFWKLHPKQRSYLIKEVFGIYYLQVFFKRIKKKLF
ncbi:MAG: glycosyl transferase family 2 [Flavobacteriaceae bacterium]|nr:glycosyl transferase family 2 [Flavobacteriaceae bacterium]|tara:strand:- start:47788 stop:48657 length:870 start_codon:yes stop_codon:yes gene_type:complete